LALDLPEAYFAPMIRKPIALMRVNHYAPQPDASNDEEIGGRPHTDYECFTILAQEGDIVALQIVDRSGEWISVPPIPGTFVINIADQMARWTNDRFASTMHRVVNRNPRDRLSIAFFFGTDDDVEMTALPGCVPAGTTPKYPPIRAGDYILGRVNNAYDGALIKT
jgi:isopenicillin N synthase-like dioxygenase